MQISNNRDIKVMQSKIDETRDDLGDIPRNISNRILITRGTASP